MSTAKPLSFQCRHILPEGRRCQAPCLRHEELCYHHHTTRKPLANPRRRRARRATFDFPVLEDHTAIRLALGEILARIAANALDPRRAGLLLYGLQIAALTLPKLAPAKQSEPSAHVEDIVLDPILGPLAPRAHIPTDDLDKTGRGRTLAEILIEDWHAGHPTNFPPNPDPAPSPQSGTIPAVQAVAEPQPRVPHVRRSLTASTMGLLPAPKPQSSSRTEAQRSGGTPELAVALALAVYSHSLLPTPVHPPTFPLSHLFAYHVSLDFQ
jgi:hypothetical protein